MTSLSIALFFFPAAICVCLGWWFRHPSAQSPSASDWRVALGLWALWLSTFGVVLETAFMIRSFAYSYLPSPSLLWMVGAWFAVLTWIVAILAAILGRGRLRWFLLLYAVTSALSGVVFVRMTD